MFICVCYELTEDTINTALNDGVATSEIYEHFDCDAPCERCWPFIEELAIEKNSNNKGVLP